VILSVDIGEGREIVQAFVQEQDLTFPILLDENGAVALGYRVRGVPTSFFINRDGVIQAQYTGPLNESLIEKHLDQIL
jgi:peroxiredoxin